MVHSEALTRSEGLLVQRSMRPGKALRTVSIRFSNEKPGATSQLRDSTEQMTTVRRIKINPHDALLMGKNLSTLAKGTDEDGEWYFGFVEVFHQVCGLICH